MIHKTVEGISLGASFTRAGHSFKEIALFLGVFSLVSPLGIVIGLFITDADALVSLCFLGLSGGTFIYVACSEIIVHEFDKGKHAWAMTLAVLAGGIIITCVWFMGEA
jgi:zinc transporter ZupT